jgi:hypothetical protein
MERSLGSLDGVRGHTYDSIFDLLFTTERVIALIVQHPTDVSQKFGFTELFLGEKLARQLERFDKKKSEEEPAPAYKDKTFDELLADHRFNFEIPYRIVTTVEITHGLLQRRLKFHLKGSSIVERTIHFTLAKKQVPEAQNLLHLALPLKIKEE